MGPFLVISQGFPNTVQRNKNTMRKAQAAAKRDWQAVISPFFINTFSTEHSPVVRPHSVEKIYANTIDFIIRKNEASMSTQFYEMVAIEPPPSKEILRAKSDDTEKIHEDDRL